MAQARDKRSMISSRKAFVRLGFGRLGIQNELTYCVAFKIVNVIVSCIN